MWRSADLLALTLVASSMLVDRPASATEMVETIAGAWSREIRTLLPPLTPEEAPFYAVADLALDGRMIEAERALATLESSAVSPEQRFLAREFRHRLLGMKEEMVSGGFAGGGDGALRGLERQVDESLLVRDRQIDLSRLPQALVFQWNEAAAMETRQANLGGALALLRFAPFLPDNRTPEAVQDARTIPVRAELLGAEVGRMLFRAPQAFDLWLALVGMHVARAAEDEPLYQLHYRNALVASAGHPCASAEVALVAGDHLAAPFGDVRTLGLDLSIRGSVDRYIAGGLPLPRQASSPSAEALAGAERSYKSAEDRAATCRDPRLSYRLKLRRAHLAFIPRRGDAAELYRSAAVEADKVGALRDAALARAAASLIQGRGADLRAAIRAAHERGDFGVVMSIAELTASWATRLLYLLDDAPTAVELLTAAHQELDSLGYPATAVELSRDLETIFGMLDRTESSIALIEEAIGAQRKVIERIGEIVARNRTKVPMAQDFGLPQQAKVTLAVLLNGLIARLSVMAGDEGDSKWIERRNLAEREFEKADGPALLGHFATTQLNDKFRFAAELRRALSRVHGCTGVLRVIAERRDDIAVGPDERLMLASAGARCSAEHRKSIEDALARTQTPELVVAKLEAVRAGLASRTGNGDDTVALNGEIGQLRVRAQPLIRDLAMAESIGAHQQWADLLERCAPFARAERDPLVGWLVEELRLSRARLDVARGNAAAALPHLQALLARPRRLSGLDGQFRIRTLDALVRAEASLGHALEALRAREMAIAEVDELRAVRSGAVPASPLSAELAALERVLAYEGKSGATDRARLVALRGAASAERRQPFHLPTLEEVQGTIKKMPPNHTAIVFYSQEPKVLAWVVSAKEGARIVPVDISTTELSWKVARLSGLVSSDQDPSALAKELGADLGPILAQVPEKDTLVLVDDGPFALAPFELLIGSSGRPLVDDHAVVHTDRIFSVEDELKPQSSRSSAVAVGVNGLGLQLAEGEAREVAAALGGEALVGAAATRQAVLAKLGTARYVHIAAHSALDRTNPLASALLLASGERLEAWTLFTRAPAVELFTLSACATGTRVGPNGLYSLTLTGLARRAGARAVIGSLWPVEDRETRALMRNLHESLARGAAPSAALHEAKLAALARRVRPHYFAPFTLSVPSVRSLRASSQVTER